MQAISYTSAGNVTPKNSYNPSLAPENRIGLLPEHIAFIDKTLRRQIVKISFTSYELRILFAIHDQTLGYDKFEDDMNGTRLCQLTGIRNDHANNAVRSLEANNVIITRHGHYGKWMSINFDLNHWLKQHSNTHSNDPRILLPAYYQDTPIDSGLPLSRPVFETAPETVVVTERPVTKMPVTEKPVTEKPIAKKIITEQSIETSQDMNSTDINIPATCLNNNLSDEKVPQPAPIEIKKPTKPKETTETTETTNSVCDFEYPVSIAEPLRKKMAVWLRKISNPQEAQEVLNYFAQCLPKKGVSTLFKGNPY